MRLVSGGRDLDRSAALESQMGGFETRTLTAFKNLAASADFFGKRTDRVRQLRKRPSLILDIDSSERPVHGTSDYEYGGQFANITASETPSGVVGYDDKRRMSCKRQ